MLVLSRDARKGKNEVVLEVGDEQIVVRVMRGKRGEIRIGFTASQNVRILRRELLDKEINEPSFEP